MKMTKRKIFSIIISSITLLLFVFSFIPHYKVSGYGFSSTINLWDGNKAQPVILLFAYIGIITVYLLSLFNILKEKWVTYANYAVGYVVFSYIGMFFGNLDYLYVGVILGVLVALALGTLSVLWYFISDKPMGAPVTGYDPATGKPIYAQPKGFDPVTGKPIYEEK